MDITLYDVYIKIKLLIKGIIGDEKINNQNKKNNKKSEKRVNNDTIEVVVQDNNWYKNHPYPNFPDTNGRILVNGIAEFMKCQWF